MKGEKTGGRRKGTPNIPRPRGGLVAAACDRVGVNPFEELALLVKKRNHPDHARPVYEPCGYLAPKLRAIEHTGAGGGPIEANISARDFILSAIAETDAGSEATGGNQPSDGTAG